MTKRPVAQARLTEFLRLRGATPFVCLLPQTDGHKCGVDDFLAQEHTLQDLERFLRSPDDKGQYAVLPPERQWEAEILRTGTTQAPRTCLGNIELFLVNHPRLKGEWWWNPRTLRPMRGQAVVDATTIDITITGLHRLGMAVHNRDMVEEAIPAVFGRHRPGAVGRKLGTPG